MKLLGHLLGNSPRYAVWTLMLALATAFTAAKAQADAAFIRGDTNQDGRVQVSDAVAALGYLFLGRSTPACLDTADADDDGATNLSDPIFTLSFLFLGGPAIPAPYPECGLDPTPDQLGCGDYRIDLCPALQAPQEAGALSNHYVSVKFAEPVFGALLDVQSYEITDGEGGPFEVLEARPDSDDELRVILATESQATVEYSLALTEATERSGGGAGGGAAVGPNSSIVFQGSDDAEPRVVTAISLGSTEEEGKVLLTFSEPVEKGALDIRFYKISAPDLDILGAELSDIGSGGTTIILTTEPQRNLEYTVKVTNVKSRAGDFLVDPTRNTVSFFGIPPVDTDLPRLLSAAPITNTTVLLSFSEPLWPGGDDARNFSISCFDPFTGNPCPDLVIDSAESTDLDTQIVLTTQKQMPGAEYTVVVADRCGSPPERDNCVQDLQENPIDPTGNSATFVGRDREQPFLSSAISLGPDPVNPDDRALVLLTFSEPVLAGATNPAFYSISDPDLDIFAAELSSDGLTVELTTEAQENIPYTVKVTNVESRGGEYFIDPARNTAVFDGIPPVDLVAPRLLSAVSTTNTTVLLSFSEPLLDTAANPSLYSISFSANETLAVLAAELTRRNTQVVLTTLPQAPLVDYTVTVLDVDDLTGTQIEPVMDMQENPIDPAENVATFRFVFEDITVPFLESATSLSPSEVLLTFSEPMGGGIASADSYRIANPELGIESVTPADDGVTVLLETTVQAYIPYTVVVTNVKSRVGRFLIDSERNSATFVGTAPLDEVRPTLDGAVASSSVTLLLSFSEPLADSAADPTRYVITHELPEPGVLGIVDAQLSAQKTQVLLTTLPMLANIDYEIVVAGVTDRAEPVPNEIAPMADNPVVFFFPGESVTDDEILTRIMGAVSTGNTRVVVAFNRPMANEALDPSNYVIVQESVNPEVGALAVQRVPADENAEQLFPAFGSDGQDRSTIVLATSPQNEVTYRVIAVGLRDVFGNRIASEVVLGWRVVSGNSVTFPGTPPSGGPFTDSDSDGLPDHEELRGWEVSIELFDKRTVVREVTSDPYLRDTDGDGVDDREERRRGSDPRNRDTDFDRLEDQEEIKVLISDPADQDTDDDGLDDQDEVEFFKTNINLADSDGDGFADAAEIFEMNRDPRIADLPQHGIVVGEVRLRIDERFTFVDENGETVTESSSTTTTLEQESATQQSRSSTDVGNFLIEAGFRGGQSDQAKGSNSGFPFKQGFVTGSAGGEFTREVGQESARAASEAFERSLEKGRELSDTASVTREIVGASIEVNVTLENLGDVAFSVGNLEISVLATDPRDRERFFPVATLIPNRTLITGEDSVFHLGPFDQARGPINFSSRDVFPSLVEDLLRDPRGLVFKVVNLDLTDEFGRNFAFASQVARDRTTGLIVDFGDGNVERYLMSTAAALNRPRDETRCVRGDREGEECASEDDCPDGLMFASCEGGSIAGGISTLSGTGVAGGISIDYALEDILGLEKNPTGNDGILAGKDRSVSSFAQGDDIQLVPPGIDGVPADTIVIAAGEDGVLDTAPRGDDVAAVVTGYETTETCGADTPTFIVDGGNGRVDTRPEGDDELEEGVSVESRVDPGTRIIGPGDNGVIDTVPKGPGNDDFYIGPGLACTDDTEAVDCFGGKCDGPEVLFRFKNRRLGDFNRRWVILVPQLPTDVQEDDDILSTDFGALTMRPGETIALAFVRDEDRDGLIAQAEFLFGSKDNDQDSDKDGLDDFAEVKVGWEVDVAGSPLRRVFPDPANPDSDGDGLTDFQEFDLRDVLADPGDANAVFGRDDDVPFSTDPRRIDTDDDLVSDREEILGYLTGAAIVEPGAAYEVILAAEDRVADTLACPDSLCSTFGVTTLRECAGHDECLRGEYCLGATESALGVCVEPCRIDHDCAPPGRCDVDLDGRGDANAGFCFRDEDCGDDVDCAPYRTCGGDPEGDVCVNDSECPSGVECKMILAGSCSHDPEDANGCQDIQVVPVGTRVDELAVVVAPGAPSGELHPTTTRGDNLPASDKRIAVDRSEMVAGTRARGDDLQVIPVGRTVAAGDEIIKPGVNGRFDSAPHFEKRCNGGDPAADTCSSDEDCTDGPGPCLMPLEQVDDVILLGRDLRRTDPLVRDFDSDSISDGLERRLGTDPRDPSDGDDFVDSDDDGLTDNEETAVGWIVTVDGRSRTVYSNPSVGDTDLDGLPDFVERQFGTDPTSTDSDGDGLSDYDEPDANALDEFAEFNELFRGFFLDSRGSDQLGTDPTRSDTDRDGLSDSDELEGYLLRVPGQGDASRVVTDPVERDTDFDGLIDGVEKSLGTDASQADTDDDGRSDGEECCRVGDDQFVYDDLTCGGRADGDECETDDDCDGDEAPEPCLPRSCEPGTVDVCLNGETGQGTLGGNPLVPDIRVNVRLLRTSATWSENAEGAEWWWNFFVQTSDQAYPGTRVSSPKLANDQGVGCGRTGIVAHPGYDENCNMCRQPSLFSVPLGAERSLVLRDGQGFTLHGTVVEIDFNAIGLCGDSGRAKTNSLRIWTGVSSDVGTCAMTVPVTTFRYDDLVGQGFLTRSLDFDRSAESNAAGCEGSLVLQIEVE